MQSVKYFARRFRAPANAPAPAKNNWSTGSLQVTQPQKPLVCGCTGIPTEGTWSLVPRFREPEGMRILFYMPQTPLRCSRD